MSEDRYEIRGKIGQGGVGAVYRAYDRNLNREVAIKRVLTEEGFDANDEEDEATKALLKEATALCSVQHPHIVTVYDAGVDGDGPYVVMELLSGRTLDEMVERGTMTWVDFRETAVQSLEALIAAQELNLVHRDIKPSNVMVTWLPSGKFQIKLVDFGLAKFSAKPSLQTIDHGDAVFGSIHFMAPEQFERVPLDQRTDMYSLGCVFFFCLTGHYPFDGETAPMVMAAHLQNEFTPLKEYRPDLPDWLCQWVEWHIARQPDERPKDARESLERFLAFEQPIEQVPVEVQVAPAASLNQPSLGTQPVDGPSHLTGPVPVHSTGPVPLHSTQPVELPKDAIATEGDDATTRPKLITGSPIDQAAAQNPQNESPVTEPKAATVPLVVPQPITPPEGAKPSIHTGSQVVKATTGPVPLQATHYTTPVPPTGAAAAKIPQPPKPVESAATPNTVGSDSAATSSMVTSVKPVKGKSHTVKIAIAVVLGIGIVVTSILLFDAIGNKERESELTKLMESAANPTTTEIPMSEAHVDGFLSKAAALSYDKEKGAIYQTLYLATSNDGVDIDKKIADFATSRTLTEQVRSKLFQVLGKRGNEVSVPYLLKFARKSEEEKSVVMAIDATGKNLSSRDLEDLYKMISSTKSDDIRAASERAVKRFLSSQSNNSVAGKSLLMAFRSSLEAQPRESFLRLLGATGAPEAETAVEEAFSSEEDTLRVSAYAALANWRDGSMFEKHFAAVSAEKETFLRTHAFDSMISFLAGDADFGNTRRKMWTQVAADLRDSREKKEFIRTLARGSEQWAMDLVEPLTKDSNDDTSFLAEKALESMARRR